MLKKGTKQRKKIAAASKTDTASYVNSFSLILEGASELTSAIADALYEAGCDDALIGSRDGVLFADFDREAPSFAQAVASAIQQVESAGVGLTVVRIEPDELISTAEIAIRAGLNRETIRLYALGRRGPGNFPPPVARLRNRSPLYRWTDVVPWLTRHGSTREDWPEADVAFESAFVISMINAVLDLRRLAPRGAERGELRKTLAEFDFLVKLEDRLIAVEYKSDVLDAPARRQEPPAGGGKGDPQ